MVVVMKMVVVGLVVVLELMVHHGDGAGGDGAAGHRLVRCDNEEFGCEVVVKLDILAMHLKECEHNPKKPVACVLGCGLTVPKDEMVGFHHNLLHIPPVVLYHQPITTTSTTIISPPQYTTTTNPSPQPPPPSYHHRHLPHLRWSTTVCGSCEP